MLAEGDTIGIAEFPLLAAHDAGPTDHDAAHMMIDASPDMAPDFASAGAPALTMSRPSLALTDSHDDVRPLEEIERETIRFAIAHYRGQMSEVARRLKIGRSTLYRKLEGLGLEAEANETSVNETTAAE